MPSNAMVQYKAPFYLEQSNVLEEIISTNDLKMARFIREAVMLVISDSDLLRQTISECNKTSYRKTGANVGVWKQTQITKYKKARERVQPIASEVGTTD
jgi:hypothetical protein